MNRLLTKTSILRNAARFCTAPTKEVKEVQLNRLKRIGNYFKNIADDYKDVAVETLQDIKARPIKSTIYFSLLGGTILLGKKNPSEVDFKQQLTDYSNELLQIGDPVRNPISDNHMQTILRSYNAGELRYLNLLFFSIMWRDNFHPATDLYEAQAKPLKVGWLDLPDRTMDIGFFGKWWWVEKAMDDFDINPYEWGDAPKQQ